MRLYLVEGDLDKGGSSVCRGKEEVLESYWEQQVQRSLPCLANKMNDSC